MADPIITFWDSTDSTQLSSIPWGSCGKGVETSEYTMNVWNNKGGSSPVDDAINCSITTMTYTGLESGDTVANGQEVVSDTMLNAKCTSYGDTSFTAVGGSTTTPIGYTTSTATLKGSTATPSEQKATVVLKMSVPSDATGASINFKIRLNYSQSE